MIAAYVRCQLGQRGERLEYALDERGSDGAVVTVRHLMPGGFECLTHPGRDVHRPGREELHVSPAADVPGYLVCSLVQRERQPGLRGCQCRLQSDGPSAQDRDVLHACSVMRASRYADMGAPRWNSRTSYPLDR